MKFRRHGGNWGCFQIFLSGLLGAIFINYLVVGFVDFILNINAVLTWLQNNETFNALLRTFFR